LEALNDLVQIPRPFSSRRNQHTADIGGDSFGMLFGHSAEIVGHGLHGSGGNAVPLYESVTEIGEELF
jgi:hypothetical protein